VVLNNQEAVAIGDLGAQAALKLAGRLAIILEQLGVGFRQIGIDRRFGFGAERRWSDKDQA
jgi:hypothetical protein